MAEEKCNKLTKYILSILNNIIVIRIIQNNFALFMRMSVKIVHQAFTSAHNATMICKIFQSKNTNALHKNVQNLKAVCR